MNHSTAVAPLQAQDLEEDCRTLLGIASMGVELGRPDLAVSIVDSVLLAAPQIREAHFASVLFRIFGGNATEALVGAEALRERFPDWTTGRILLALAMNATGSGGWQAELEQAIDEADDDLDIEFARALLDA